LNISVMCIWVSGAYVMLSKRLTRVASCVCATAAVRTASAGGACVGVDVAFDLSGVGRDAGSVAVGVGVLDTTWKPAVARADDKRRGVCVAAAFIAGRDATGGSKVAAELAVAGGSAVGVWVAVAGGSTVAVRLGVGVRLGVNVCVAVGVRLGVGVCVAVGFFGVAVGLGVEVRRITGACGIGMTAPLPGLFRVKMVVNVLVAVAVGDAV